jgi:hypothetical protein
MRKSGLKICFVAMLAIALMLASFASASTLTLRPNGQGYYSAWTNSGCGSGSSEYQCVNEDPANTSSNLQTNSKSVAESFAFDDTGLTTETINSVTLYYYGAYYSSSRYQFQPLIRASSTDYLGTTKSLTSSYATYSQTYNTNPATGSAWTIAQVNALEAGMKSYSASYGGIIAQMYAIVDYNPPDTCSDSDGGFAYTVFGQVTGNLNYSYYNYSDYCLNSTVVIEYFCSANRPYSSSYPCNLNSSMVCSEGRCI